MAADGYYCIPGWLSVYAFSVTLPGLRPTASYEGGGMVRGHRRLSAKAIAPAQAGLVRERLFTVAGSRLGLVLAPAGYGKWFG